MLIIFTLYSTLFYRDGETQQNYSFVKQKGTERRCFRSKIFQKVEVVKNFDVRLKKTFCNAPKNKQKYFHETINHLSVQQTRQRKRGKRRRFNF